MAVTNFIPVVWSTKMLDILQSKLVYAQVGIVNRDYEGEIKDQGSKVKITSLGDITVKDYTVGTNIDDPEVLNSSQVELDIDKAKYFNFSVDDVNNLQANVDLMPKAIERASYNVAVNVDATVSSVMVANVGSANVLGTSVAPVSIDTTNAYDQLVDLSVLLSESETPEENRFVIIPAWYHGILLKDSRFVATGSVNAENRLQNGMVGTVAGMRVLTSNKVPKTGSTYQLLAGHEIATTIADQIVKVEAYRPEKTFSDAIKGLYVYGIKVIRPLNLAKMHATKA